MTNRLTALTDIGGVNSIRSFTRSWRRAAGFTEVIPQRPSFVFAPDQAPIGGLDAGDAPPYGQGDLEAAPERGPAQRSPLLHQPLDDAEAPTREESPEPGTSRAPLRQPSVDFREREQKALEQDMVQAFRVGSHTSVSGSSIFAVPPHLVAPSLVGSYGSAADYGTIRSDVSRASMAQAAAMWRQQQEAGGNVPDGEIAPILVKEVEQDGKIVLSVEGQSTLPQTVFNSTKYVVVLLSGLN